MKYSIKNVSIIIALLVLNSFSHSVLAADSTAVKRPHVHPKVEAYLLAQGSVTSAGQLERPTTNLRCGTGTKPYLRTSLNSTYVNSFYAIRGIVNTLAINTSNYHITGKLYMDNKGTYDESSVTANWQVWCQPA